MESKLAPVTNWKLGNYELKFVCKNLVAGGKFILVFH